jgi:hypothetical protein
LLSNDRAGYKPLVTYISSSTTGCWQRAQGNVCNAVSPSPFSRSPFNSDKMQSFYTGWRNAFSALPVVKEVFEKRQK